MRGVYRRDAEGAEKTSTDSPQRRKGRKEKIQLKPIVIPAKAEIHEQGISL